MQDQNILKQAVIENLAKDKKDRLTHQELASMFGLTRPRITQIASGLKVKPELTADTPEPVSEAQEA